MTHLMQKAPAFLLAGAFKKKSYYCFTTLTTSTAVFDCIFM